jgi:hypothetical protein
MVEVSSAGSMAGYSLKKALLNNKSEIKLLVAALVGVAAFLAAPLNPPWAALAASSIGIVSKLAVDALDFWLSDVELK